LELDISLTMGQTVHDIGRKQRRN